MCNSVHQQQVAPAARMPSWHVVVCGFSTPTVCISEARVMMLLTHVHQGWGVCPPVLAPVWAPQGQVQQQHDTDLALPARHRDGVPAADIHTVVKSIT